MASDRTIDRRAKLASGKFTQEDLHPYARDKAKLGAQVHFLKVGKWVKVNNLQLLVKKIGANMDDSWIYVVVTKHHPFLNWLLQPWARLKGQVKEVLWDEVIPGTNLLLDMWFIGDGTGGHPLVVETNSVK